MGSRKSDNPAVAQASNHHENFHRYKILGLRPLRMQSFTLIAFGHSVQGSESKTWNVMEPSKNLYAQVPWYWHRSQEKTKIRVTKVTKYDSLRFSIVTESLSNDLLFQDWNWNSDWNKFRSLPKNSNLVLFFDTKSDVYRVVEQRCSMSGVNPLDILLLVNFPTKLLLSRRKSVATQKLKLRYYVLITFYVVHQTRLHVALAIIFLGRKLSHSRKSGNVTRNLGTAPLRSLCHLSLPNNSRFLRWSTTEGRSS